MHRRCKMPETHLRRLAVQLASQLPETKDEAQKVLEYLKVIVAGYLYEEKEPPNLTIVPLRPAEESGCL